MIKAFIGIIKADGFQKHIYNLFFYRLYIQIDQCGKQFRAVTSFYLFIKPAKNFRAEDIFNFFVWYGKLHVYLFRPVIHPLTNLAEISGKEHKIPQIIHAFVYLIICDILMNRLFNGLTLN